MPEKETRTIFVIMPFGATPTRRKEDLSEFFSINLKKRIEGDGSFQFRYVVRRSDDTFRINDQIVRDLYTSDIVLCDLSGREANPNVMFELGIRLSVSNKPVILFREEHSENKTIFDVSGYFIQSYNPHQYRPLEEYIVSKIKRFESGEEEYLSPVLEVLKQEPSIVSHIQYQTAIRRLQMLAFGIHSFRAKFSGDVYVFLRTQVHFELPQPLDDFLDTILHNKESLAALDWSKFSSTRLRIPALEDFISNPNIEGIIPSDCLNDFIAYSATFYDLFVNEAPSRPEVTFKSVLTLLGELALFNQMTLALMAFLSGTIVSREKALEVFSNWFSKSAFAEYVRDSVQVLTYQPGRRETRG